MWWFPAEELTQPMVDLPLEAGTLIFQMAGQSESELFA